MPQPCRTSPRTRRKLAALAALFMAAGPQAALAQADRQPVSAIGPAHSQDGAAVRLGLSKSRLLDLPADVAEVVISNPAVVEAVVRTPRRVHLIGQQVGQTSAVFIGRDGSRLLTLDIGVERDLAPVAELLKRLIRNSSIRLEAVNDNIVLTGTVATPLDASRAAEIAARFTAKREQVLNLLDVRAKEQVLLRVTVAEMNRSVIRRLGLDVRETLAAGNISVAKLVETAFPVTGGLVTETVLGGSPGALTAPAGVAIAGSWQTRNNRIEGVLQALEREGLARTLAEPNLTSVSGESADFLAGGEYPVPTGSDRDGLSVIFKPFGVRLSFTPVVLSEGRISLKIATEVSELTSDGAVTVQALTVPALSVRRASSTLELPSGGALVMAGFISTQMRRSAEGLPGVKDLPVLGPLFRSNDFIRSETELVVIVTPYLVDATRADRLTLPGEAALSGVTGGHGGPAAAARQAATPERADKRFGFIIE
jgi:pilus assembly protein CpaC